MREAVVLLGVEENRRFRLILANRAYHVISGYKEDTIGKEIGDFAPFELVEPLREQFVAVIGSKRPVTFVAPTTVPLGDRVFELDIVPVFSTVEDVVQIIVLARDITELFKLREEVQTARENDYLKDV